MLPPAGAAGGATSGPAPGRSPHGRAGDRSSSGGRSVGVQESVEGELPGPEAPNLRDPLLHPALWGHSATVPCSVFNPKKAKILLSKSTWARARLYLRCCNRTRVSSKPHLLVGYTGHHLPVLTLGKPRHSGTGSSNFGGGGSTEAKPQTQ